jgi:ABC-2 type transport system permease protein
VKHFFILLRHEIGVLLINPATYIATVVFLALMGALFQGLLLEYTRAASDTSPAIDFFHLFWLPVILLTPLLTMHSLAEERRRGTIETLLTTPVTTAEVVLAKFAASYFLYLVLWGSTASFHWLLYHFAESPGALDPGPLIGGYTFIALCGLPYIAMGIFASSLTRSQLVAALVSLALCGLFTFAPVAVAKGLNIDPTRDSLLRSLIDHVQVLQHANDFIAGAIDTRAPVLFISLAALWLFLGMLALDARSARA